MAYRNWKISWFIFYTQVEIRIWIGLWYPLLVVCLFGDFSSHSRIFHSYMYEDAAIFIMFVWSSPRTRGSFAERSEVDLSLPVLTTLDCRDQRLNPDLPHAMVNALPMLLSHRSRPLLCVKGVLIGCDVYGPCHSKCGTIRIPLWPKAVSLSIGLSSKWWRLHLSELYILVKQQTKQSTKSTRCLLHRKCVCDTFFRLFYFLFKHQDF